MAVPSIPTPTSDAADNGSERRNSAAVSASPATSISVDESSVRSRKKSPLTQTKFPPLSQYCPVGCVTFDEIPISFDRHETQDGWVLLDATSLKILDTSKMELYLVVRSLLEHGWIQAEAAVSSAIWRIYTLPADVARASVRRDHSNLRKHWTRLLASLDVRLDVWQGRLSIQDNLLPGDRFDPWASPDANSLFWMFNMIPSPAPDPDVVPNRYTRKAIWRLLDPETSPRGLLSTLYPYQRRSAALMLQRESVPTMELDPRLEPRVSPNGETFFFAPRDQLFFKEPRYYDTVRGGILAETMGLGKTIICLAVILTTKGQYPQIPPQYAPRTGFVRPKVGSLGEMAASNLLRHSIPWRSAFEDAEEETGFSYTKCVELMTKQTPSYLIPPRVVRSNRSSQIMGPSDEILLSSGTILVVPRNLLQQWQSEFAKHVELSALRLLVLDRLQEMIPPADQLAKYDVVLFSRSRFEREVRQTEELYESPLKKIHWLRLIVDEGHGFSSANTFAAVAAEKLVCAERRWIVSGTPAKDLLGIEVETQAMAEQSQEQGLHDYREQTLLQRQSFDWIQENNSSAFRSLGALVSRFLKAQPWASSPDSVEAPAVWDEYIFRHEHPKVRTYTSFSHCLRKTLDMVVIRTRPEDVERDLTLPPLTHEIIRLDPSPCDKMTANLFVLLFTVNAITSERTDQDYLFHKNSAGHLARLISNLRQSTFYWSGFTSGMVQSSLEIAEKYLAKDKATCTDADRHLMSETMNAAHSALTSAVWNALSKTQEMGVAVSDWPSELKEAWAFEGCTDPMIMGLSQCLGAQKHVNNKLIEQNPLEGMELLGKMMNLQAIRDASEASTHRIQDATAMGKTGVPDLSLSTDTMGNKRLSVSGATKVTPKKPRHSSAETSAMVLSTPPGTSGPESPTASKSSGKRRLSLGSTAVELPSDSNLGRVNLWGTTSVKFSYLINRVKQLYMREKILIFYEGPHVAYYISQALDLINIKHLIYANTLSGDQRSKYVVLFNTDISHRVLIMDIRQAAHGLNLSSASRVFFVNPPCRPDIEAQAIKRSHRIGQTKSVHVETLVLRGTVEEQMHDRAAAMSKREHLAAKTLEDDAGIRGILQNARVLRLTDQELNGQGIIAQIDQPEQMFGRPGRARNVLTGLEKELFGEYGQTSPTSSVKSKRKRTKRKDEVRVISIEEETSSPRPMIIMPISAPSIFGGSS